MASAGVKPAQYKRNRFRFCCGNHLAKTNGETGRGESLHVCLDSSLRAGRQSACMQDV
ncbi:uncharacterized protein BJ212DRAFT_1334384 [Suillus subaureus]|uniref:Uncharacterized protein n=1 Tax=Suillus subaureus TaxID=48587 RepID=A0A9P7EI05_9AGAM|nr:uncharacterized protein BJ212DRAFT_1334384 [Suillus subaureus]KAG1821896.1 hypothetical protein BJ212DRAFT_1334384 [Suillus subaureus]